jgi:hypothetical protein
MAVQLEQSPFLNLISQGRIQHMLSLMDKPADTRLTPEIAREVCERTASSAELEGSIASLGSQYILGLRAHPSDTGLCTASMTDFGTFRGRAPSASAPPRSYSTVTDFARLRG